MRMRRTEPEDPVVAMAFDVGVPTMSLVVASVDEVGAMHMKRADTVPFNVSNFATIHIYMH